MHRRVVTHYLELSNPSDFRPTKFTFVKVQVARVQLPCASLHQFLYRSVGRPWYWIDRADWTAQDWVRHLTQPGVETWVAYVEGGPAGYFELAKSHDDSVEIAYFGLMRDFIGCGIGGYLLTEAVKRSWQLGASRVWLHTCSLDHPRAFQHYRSHGFRVFDEAESYADLPAQFSNVA